MKKKARRHAGTEARRGSDGATERRSDGGKQGYTSVPQFVSTSPQCGLTAGTRRRASRAHPITRPSLGCDCVESQAVFRRALTLVELMVVIVILGILATTVTISVRDHLITGKQSAAKQELSQVMAALELFYMEHDRYPTNDEGLAVLLARTEKHPDGLLHGGNMNDPWGHPYQYVYPGLHGSYDIVCYGADGLEGGQGADADLCSWQLK